MTASPVRIRPLNRAEMTGPQLRHLLWLATEYDAERLDSCLREVLPSLGLIAAESDGELEGFAAYDNRGDQAVVEYIAVAESAQGRGLGAELIRHIRRETGRELYLETDDDAVGFYRALGFNIAAAPDDVRWAGRRRYSCRLA